MKKTYQNPAIEYLFVSPEEMIAVSNGLLGNEEQPKAIDLGAEVNETSETSGNLSRLKVWDDEE